MTFRPAAPPSVGAGVTTKPARGRRRSRWFERLMALLALVNLGLVSFDLSYIPWRDLYLKLLPELTTWYGEQFKGIEPHRLTRHYLDTVDQLQDQVAQTGLTSAAAQAILIDLQQQSAAMIAENPFQLANKSGNLERIKINLRDRLGLESATDAFTQFWSYDHLSTAGFGQEMAFFNTRVRPLIETNFFRRIAVHGGFMDQFWRIDLVFNLIFALEMLARSVYLHRRYKNFGRRDVLVWRWYDLLLIIPFSGLRLPWLALSRVIPVTVRLNQASLIDLNPLQTRLNHFLLSQVAVELTEVVILRLIDQLQTLISDGTISQTLLVKGKGRAYIDLNGVNEFLSISQRLIHLTVYDVLPEVKPDLDRLVQQTVMQAFDRAPGYQGFRQLPGVGGVPDQITQQVVTQLSSSLYTALRSTLDRPGASPDDRYQVLIQKFTDSFQRQLQQKGNLQEIESLLVTWLEEIKLNYVRRLATEDLDRLVEERYQIYNATQTRRPS
ncbi:MAG: hypothetical protein VKL98_05215 [Cyanobacteriota bacterium]|nr:hypothetical protein [Cyanobacteriota bacterium]